MDAFLERTNAFWALVQDVWVTGVFGVDLTNVIIALGIMLVALVFRRLFTSIVMNRLHRIATSDGNPMTDAMAEAMHDPVRMIPLVIGAFLAVDVLELAGGPARLGETFVRTLIVINLFWAFFNLIGPISVSFERLKSILGDAFVEWLVKALRVAIWIIGIATVLELWGIQVGPIVAGLGLFGVAVALGAQDLFKNLISGLLILAEKRYHIGDWVFVDGVVEGTVETIGFRSTVVRRFDKAPVYVPNSVLSDSAVTNFSEMTHRRIKWLVGIEYDASVDQLRQIRDGIETYLQETDAFAPATEVSTFVRIDRFSASSIDILVYCFTKTTNWGEWLQIKEDFAYRIKEIVEGAGTGFAFPSQSLYVKSLPGEAPEVFVPPRDN